jgi:hypothetical protein
VTASSDRPPIQGLVQGIRLLRVEPQWLDWLTTAAAVLLVGWFRFAHLASGPWELDEAAFARAIIDYDLVGYFPHPPGYPGWIAIGHVANLFAAEPYVALQAASAVFSIFALWPLAALGRRIAPPAVALAAAMAVLVAPGPWLYAVRGFSSTAAGVLAISAAAVAAGGLQRGRVTLFSVLVTAAFLVRPNLLPPLAVLWLGVAWGVRPLRRLVPGMAAGAAMAGAALAMMAWAQGGLGEVVSVMASHSQRHFSRVGWNTEGFLELGLVKGLGGPVLGSLLLAAAAVGLVVWARRATVRSALLWAVVLGVALGQLVWLQNRSYPRYAVGVQMALAPLVAGAAGLAPPVAGCGALLTAAGWLSWSSRPLLVEQQTEEFAAWRAVQFAAREATDRDMAVVIESEMHLFASYLWLRNEGRGVAMPPRVLTPWNPEPWLGVDRPYLVATVHRHFYPKSLVSEELKMGGVSERLYPLTQQRFLESWAVVAPPLPLSGWWPVERTPGGEDYLWGAAECELVLPPLPTHTGVAVRLRPAPGPARLAVEVNGTAVAEIDGNSAAAWLWIDADQWWGDLENRLRFVRSEGYVPGPRDERELAVQLLEVRLIGPSFSWQGSVVTADDRVGIGCRLDGHYHPEEFGDAGWGVWLEPEASLELPAGAGRLVLTMSAPRPGSPETVVRLNGKAVVGPLDLDAAPTEVVVPVASGDAIDSAVRLTISSVPYVPALAGHGVDRRPLGAVLSRVAFEPAEVRQWARPLPRPTSDQ